MATHAKTMVLWAHIQRPKTVLKTRKNSFHAARDKGRVARVPTSATVKTNSVQFLQRQNTRKKEANMFHTNTAEFQSWANTPAKSLTRVH